MSYHSDADLILQVQRGSLEALGVLYDRYRQPVYRTALAITGDSDVANDLLQDVFLRLYRFIERVDRERPLEPWLYRITVNLSYTWIKRNKRWLRPVEDIADWLSNSGRESLQQVVEDRDDFNQIQVAMSELSLQHRVVVVLYYLNDLSLQDISQILGVPVGTVKSRLYYGRKALKRRLGVRSITGGERLPDFET